MVLALFVRPCGSVAARVSSSAPGSIISSASQLKTYLQKTARSGSPLDRLSPRARARFLASLSFGPHGVGGLSTEDLRAELTRPQASAILALFGLGAYAVVVPKDVPRIPHEQYIGPDAIADHYEAFDTLARGTSLARATNAPTSVDPTLLERDYQAWFAPLQSSPTLDTLKSADVALLFRASSLGYSTTPDPMYLPGMRYDLAELRRRHFASDDDDTTVYFDLLNARRFADARAFYRDDPIKTRSSVPSFHDETNGTNDRPTALVLSSDGLRLTRRAIDVSKAIVVVASPGCHFCEDGIADIESDATISRAFQAHATWLMPPTFDLGFREIERWNERHPHDIMLWANSYEEWPMVDQ